MPILSAEPCLYPEDLFTRSGPPEACARWWVLHTRPRAEKSLARRLLGRQCAFFLPLYRRRWRAGVRVRSSYLPLFPGYLFLLGGDEDRVHALETNLVANVLPVADQPELHAELAQVHRMAGSEVPLRPEGCLAPGTPVRITRGPLAGLTGTVISTGKSMRVAVEVRLLQRGVSAEVEAWMVERLDAPDKGIAGRA